MKEISFTTKKGIRLYSLRTTVHSFTLALYIPAGPLYESSENSGMSHLLEHAIFRNINHIMGGNLYRELDKHGLTLSGATYNELVQISIQGSPRHFEKAVSILRVIQLENRPHQQVCLAVLHLRFVHRQCLPRIVSRFITRY